MAVVSNGWSDLTEELWLQKVKAGKVILMDQTFLSTTGFHQRLPGLLPKGPSSSQVPYVIYTANLKFKLHVNLDVWANELNIENAVVSQEFLSLDILRAHEGPVDPILFEGYYYYSTPRLERLKDHVRRILNFLQEDLEVDYAIEAMRQVELNPQIYATDIVTTTDGRTVGSYYVNLICNGVLLTNDQEWKDEFRYCQEYKDLLRYIKHN
jgi:hypothetical protein